MPTKIRSSKELDHALRPEAAEIIYDAVGCRKAQW